MGDLILKRPWVAIGIIVLISVMVSMIANKPYIDYCNQNVEERILDTVVTELKKINENLEQ